MKNGLAIWHYPHRTLCENIDFFASHDFDALSGLGSKIADVVSSAAAGKELADTILRNRIDFTVHYQLPSEKAHLTAEEFRIAIRNLHRWQQQYGLIKILSFDVWQRERHIPRDSINYVLERFSDTDTKIAVEDFGLNQEERAEFAHLKGNPRFGYLMDLGHLNIRMGNTPTEIAPWFTYAGESAPSPIGERNEQAILNAFAKKDFPVFEIHLHNNDGSTDWHNFLFDGILPMEAVASALQKLNYNGIITIETAPTWHKCMGEQADQKILDSLCQWQALTNQSK